MCLRIYVVPQNQTGGPACVQNLDATCAGYGSHSYADSVSQDFAYDAKLQWDPDLGMNYFQAVIIEWLDRQAPFQSHMFVCACCSQCLLLTANIDVKSYAHAFHFTSLARTSAFPAQA